MLDVNYGNLSRFSPTCPSADPQVKYFQPSALSFSKDTVLLFIILQGIVHTDIRCEVDRLYIPCYSCAPNFVEICKQLLKL